MAAEEQGGWGRSIVGLAALAAAAAFFFLQDANQLPSAPPFQSATSSAGQDAAIGVYFSPPPDGAHNQTPAPVEAALIESLGMAERSVDLAVYDFDLWRVRDALLDCRRRGIRVRMVVESDNGRQSDLLDLRAAGIPVVGDERSALMHHKFLVIDDRVVWFGSMNVTQRGVYRNNNNFLRVDSVDLATDFEREFEEMFLEDRFGALSRADTPFPFLVVGESALEVAFSPEDDVQARIVRYLERASESIDFMAFTLTADRVADALLTAAERGVRVRGVVEAERADDLGGDAGRLRSAGLDVRLDSNPDTMHNKVMVVDGRVVLTGSYNFTQSAEEHNDENFVIIDNPNVAGQYERTFEELFDAALP